MSVLLPVNPNGEHIGDGTGSFRPKSATSLLSVRCTCASGAGDGAAVEGVANDISMSTPSGFEDCTDSRDAEYPANIARKAEGKERK